GHRHKTHAGALGHGHDTGGGFDWLRSDFNDLAFWQPTHWASLASRLGHSQILPCVRWPPKEKPSSKVNHYRFGSMVKRKSCHGSNVEFRVQILVELLTDMVSVV